MEFHCYIIIYDLRTPGRNYSSLYQAIKDYGTWGKISESAWAVVSSQNSVEIRDNLMKYLDSNDRLMVVRSGQDAAWVNAMASKDWLQENLVK